MKAYPYIIRLSQLVTDLPDLIDESQNNTDTTPELHPERIRVGLAHEIIFALGNTDLTSQELDDPIMGASAAQKALQDIINTGYLTLFSAEALAIHALDMRTQQGFITEEDTPLYARGELDPTEHIEQFLADHQFVSIPGPEGSSYYTSPDF